MMSTRSLIPAVLLVLTAACGGGQRTTSTIDVDETYDFSGVRTYSLVELAPPAGLNQGSQEFMERYDVALGNALRGELNARGLTEVEAGEPADLAVTFTYGGDRQAARAQLANEIGTIVSVEGKMVVRASDWNDMDGTVWQHQVDFFIQSEWPEIEQAEERAPRVAAQLMEPFPIPRQDAEGGAGD